MLLLAFFSERQRISLIYKYSLSLSAGTTQASVSTYSSEREGLTIHTCENAAFRHDGISRGLGKSLMSVF